MAREINMYGKIFKSMYEGTLYGQWEAIVTMQQFIVLADRDGIVDMTPPSIAAQTSIPLEIIEKGIKTLESDDPYSRTEGQNGKRLRLLNPERPWGWEVVNYKKYSEFRTKEDRRVYMKEYMRKYRVNNCKQPLAQLADVDVDVDVDVDKKNIQKRPFSFLIKTLIPEKIFLTEDMIHYTKCKRWTIKPEIGFEAFVSHHRAKGTKFQDWHSAFQKWVQNDIKWHPENQECETELV
jgi:hypothetical protein